MLQDKALEILKSGENVFLTGAAGAGKTYVLNKFIEHLKEEGIKHAVTASTGIAATHLNGITIHSWSGIGIKDTLTEMDVARIKNHKYLGYNYRSTKVLIIDEISMLHGYQIRMIDIIAKRILENKLPFGGIQVVVCGDFFQLPPVSQDREQGVKYAYETPSWEKADFKVCYLSEQHRQDDRTLTDVLNAIRNSKVTETTQKVLKDHSHKGVDNSEVTKLYTHNINVDAVNDKELEKIQTEERTFTMGSWGNQYEVESLKKRCLAKETLRLKVGARVMFIKNDQKGQYVNGTIGYVTGYTNGGSGIPIVQTESGNTIVAYSEEWKIEKDDEVVATICQIPLALAWAITIHKSQGMTLDSAQIDLSGAFELGMGYVALSRIKSLEGLNLIGLNGMALRVNPKITAQDKIFREKSENNNGYQVSSDTRVDNKSS